MVLPRHLVASALLLGAALSIPTSAPMAQEGILLRNMLGSIGLLPNDKDPIEYRERAPLVVPKDTSALRAPEAKAASARNPQWPVDPDVEARKAEAARRGQTQRTRNEETVDGKRLTQEELAAGRKRGAGFDGDPYKSLNDKSGVLATPAEMASTAGFSQNPTYAPGTEPPRQYLTDPPKGLRLPAAGAPMKASRDNSVVEDELKGKNNPWGRLD